MGQDEKRNVATETSMEQTGNTPAVSSHKALRYDLIDPDTIRALARRKTSGADKYGSMQYRQSIEDPEYVTDRLNHFWEHVLNFMVDGDEYDANSEAILWFMDMVQTIKRECPEVLKEVLGKSRVFGRDATLRHLQEVIRRSDLQEKFGLTKEQAMTQLLDLQSAPKVQV